MPLTYRAPLPDTMAELSWDGTGVQQFTCCTRRQHSVKTSVIDAGLAPESTFGGAVVSCVAFLNLTSMKPNICARVRSFWGGNSKRIFAFCFSLITAPAKFWVMKSITCFRLSTDRDVVIDD